MKISSIGISLALTLSANAVQGRRLGDPELFDAFDVRAVDNDSNKNDGKSSLGAVFVMTNQVDNNEVVSYSRNSTGMLTHVGNYETGGQGFPYKNDILLPDNAIGTQGALVVGGDYVFVVNAGSDSFSQFKINHDMSLSLLSVTPTPQKFPCTLDARLDLNTVCVGMCAGEGAIACYEISKEGQDDEEAVQAMEVARQGDGEGNSLTQIHFVESMGIPIGVPPMGNPEDPYPEEGRPGINVLVNIKQVLFAPDGNALYVSVFNKGIYVFPTEQDEESSGLILGESVLHSIDEGEFAIQHRPFSFAFQETKAGNLLLHVQDPFATLAAETYFPPNVAIGLSAGGTLSTYRVDGTGANSTFVNLMPQVGAGQKGACWVAYNNHTIAVTNTASGSVTVYRELDFLGEGIYDVATADMRGTDADIGMIGFHAGPFAESGGSSIHATPVDLAFSADGSHFYVLNSVARVVDIYSVNPNENSIQGSQSRAQHVGAVEVPGVPDITSDPEDAGDDEEWKRQIGYWEAWSGAAGMQGLDTYPRPRA